MNRRNKKEQGITLVALVVTIVVLLILASVSIATLTGENGIITQANNAKEKTIIESEKEAINIAYIGCKGKNYKNIEENIIASQLQTELNKNGNDAVVEDLDTNLIVIFEKTKNKYIVEQDGQIIAEKEAKEIIINAGNYYNYLYWETLTGEVYIQLWEEKPGYFEVNKNDSTIVTKNGIKDMGFNYLLDKEGKIYMIGDNEYGQLGNGTTVDSDKPICINDIDGNPLNGKNIVQVIPLDDRMIVLDSEGKLYVWGYNEDGRLGNGAVDNVLTPICINDIDSHILNRKKIIKVVTIGYDEEVSIFVLDDEGKAYSWGNNTNGQLGYDSPTDYTTVSMCINEMRFKYSR